MANKILSLSFSQIDRKFFWQSLEVNRLHYHRLYQNRIFGGKLASVILTRNSMKQTLVARYVSRS